MPRPSVHPLWSSLALDRRSGVSLQEQIAEFFRNAIADGRMQGGQRVVSSRQLAIECGVSRTTAVEACQRLVAEGYIITRRGAGMFVAAHPPENFALRAAPAQAPPPGPPDITRLDMRNYLLPLAPGMPAIDRFPWNTWARLTNQICRERPLNAVGYGEPQGEAVLRRAIADYLATARGIVCSPEQIVVMAGSEQSLEYVVSLIAVPGDSAWVEEPVGPYVRHVLSRAGVVPVPLEVDQDGMDVTGGLLRAPAARLAIVSPTHQYPTGTTLSLSRRQALVEWCETAGAWILENEIDGDYRYAPRPITPLHALSRQRRVFYCGSLSKPLAPGLRTNYLVMPEQLVPQLALRTTLVPMLTQLVLARFNSAGHMALHMRRMRTLYARRRSVLLEALRRQVQPWLVMPRVPEGGLRVTA
ncbi:MAG: PLP-dependent aminotransferase family protein, partial [Pseudomonadota bacterium]|nr:PLP-dependent aminotransferase family protein [Pseudomonadota bacterium]